MKVIVDCDPGIDDIYALMLTSLVEDVEVLAVTVVHGNSTLENCFLNTQLAVQKIFHEKKKPPVYYGSASPFMENRKSDGFWGLDGIANTSFDLYKKEMDALKEEYELHAKESNEYAASKIVELINTYPNEVTILALGPLTNIALAHRLSKDEENFSKKIKKLIIMDYSVFTSVNYPEFNFAVDPVAAKIVIEEFKCDTQIVTFDACLRSFSIKVEEVIQEFEKYIDKSGRVHFIERLGISHWMNIAGPIYGFEALFSCDLVAAIVAFYAKELRIESKAIKQATVEIAEPKMEGLFKVIETDEPAVRNIEVVIKIDKEQVENVFKQHLAKLAALDHQENLVI